VKIVYGVNARLAGSGIGYRAYQAALAAHHRDLLVRLLVSSNAQTRIPHSLVREWGAVGRGSKFLAARDPTGLLYHVEGVAFDAWSSMHLPAADLFCGWLGGCLRTLRRAGRRGMATVVDSPCSHPLTRLDLLRQESEHWSARRGPPTWSQRRSIRELSEADYVLVPSGFARQSMLDAGLSAEKLVEIPLGVDLEEFHPARAAGPRPFRVVFAGQVSLRKGVPYLLEAWRRLALADAELWIIGDVRPDFSALRTRWSGLANVRYVDHTHRLADLLRECDVFVLPSIEEGSARVTYEALACGLPVITTPNAGSPVRDGQDGFIVPIRDVEALCERVQRLHDDSALQSKLSRSARQRAEQLPWTRYQKTLVDALQQMVSR
jgi:glycosyltransferase involved in cell wall biosynthesis